MTTIDCSGHRNLTASLTLVNEDLRIDYSNGKKTYSIIVHIPTSTYKLLPKDSSMPLRFPFLINDITVYCPSPADRLQWISCFESIQRVAKLTQPSSLPSTNETSDSIKIVIENKITNRLHNLFFAPSQYSKFTINQFKNHIARLTQIPTEDQEIFINDTLIQNNSQLLTTLLPQGGTMKVSQSSNTTVLIPPDFVPETVDLVGTKSKDSTLSVPKAESSLVDSVDDCSDTVVIRPLSSQKPNLLAGLDQWLGKSDKKKGAKLISTVGTEVKIDQSSSNQSRDESQKGKCCGVCNGAVVQELRRLQAILSGQRLLVTDLLNLTDSLVGELRLLGADLSTNESLKNMAQKCGYDLIVGTKLE
ncbi:hypothetical protein RCL1_005071 [Eukaryota sp. TZLM3-RCL]